MKRRRRDGVLGIPGTEPESDAFLEYEEYLEVRRNVPDVAITRDEYDGWHADHCDRDLHEAASS